MTGLNRKFGVASQEVRGHRDLGSIWQQHRLVPCQLLDVREDVIPAAAVQTCRVVAQLVQDLVHLEGGQNRFDEHGRPNGSGFQP